MDLRDRNFQDEFYFQTSRSSGPGGQHVNKVSSKVELRFHVANSALLSEDEKAVIAVKLVNKINQSGELILVSQSERSQLKNKENVVEKFYLLLERALAPRKKRLKTKPDKASIERRLSAKRLQSRLKSDRKDVEL